MSDSSKRRRWLTIIALSVVATGLLLWWLSGRPGAPADAVAFLPDKGVVAALFIDDPADLIVALDERFTRPADEAGADAAQSRRGLREFTDGLGFEVRRAEAWEQIGVDESAGIAAVVYERTGPSPIILLDVEDKDRFFKWLARRFRGAEPDTDRRGVQLLEMDEVQILVGRRGRFTALMRAGPSKRAAFEQFIEAKGRLVTDPAVLRAFLAARTRPRLVAFAQTGALVDLFDVQSRWIRDSAVLMPSVKGYLDDESGGVRIDASDAATGQLKQVFELPAKPPAFSRLVPQDWSAMRLSISVSALDLVVSRSVAAVDTSRAEAPGWLPYAEGLRAVVDRIGDRFTGHLVLAVSNASLSRWLASPDGNTPEWIVFAHLRDGAPPINALKLPVEMRVLDGVVAFSASRALLDGVKRLPANQQPPEGHLILDEPTVIFALATEASKLLDAARGAIPPSVLSLFQSSQLANKARLSVGFGWDGTGIASRGDAGALLATIGLAGLIVAPQLAERRRARQQIEAEDFLRRIAEGARAAWQHPLAGAAADRRLPSVIPRTPSNTNCRGYPPRPAHWDTAGWRALGFSIHGSHRYQYSFESDAKGFTARAEGDLDCDGLISTIEIIGEVVGDDIVLRGRRENDAE